MRRRASPADGGRLPVEGFELPLDPSTLLLFDTRGNDGTLLRRLLGCALETTPSISIVLVKRHRFDPHLEIFAEILLVNGAKHNRVVHQDIKERNASQWAS